MSLRLLCARQGAFVLRRPAHSRTIFNFIKRLKPGKPQEPVPILSEDNLFHPFSKSPFPPVRARGEAIQQLAPCPVCALSNDHIHEYTKAQPKAVKFECPECGWPTHCSEEHWRDDTEHRNYCSRLREANEDEHDLRSGRRMREFELPGIILSVDLHLLG
jgi:splicing suppressor protein 51